MRQASADALARIAISRLVRCGLGQIPLDVLDEVDGREESQARDADARAVDRRAHRIAEELETAGVERLARLGERFPRGRTLADVFLDEDRRAGRAQAAPFLDDLQRGAVLRISGVEGVPDGAEFVIDDVRPGREGRSFVLRSTSGRAPR